MIERNENRYQVRGPMSISSARVLLEAGRELLLAEQAPETVLDLAQVEDVDSSALAVVFGMLRTAKERGVNLVIANPPSSLISLADLYGVSDSLALA